LQALVFLPGGREQLPVPQLRFREIVRLLQAFECGGGFQAVLRGLKIARGTIG
jgi:hypothetical protein